MLVDEPPPPPGPAAIDDSDPIEYDLNDWPEEWRSALTWMVEGRRIPLAWDPPGVLVVPARAQDAVDGFIEYIEAGPDPDDPAGAEERAASIGTEWRNPSSEVGELTVDEFYDADPARQDSSEYEFGAEWVDGEGNRCEVCWVEATGELYVMHSPADTRDDLTIEVLGVVSTLDRAEALLEGWEQAMAEPNGIAWVRERVEAGLGASSRDAPVARTPDREPDVVAGLDRLDPAPSNEWDVPAVVGWLTPLLDDVRAYALRRQVDGPDAALASALRSALDDASYERLDSYLRGGMDVVYGDGTGEWIRTVLRDECEATL